jgi:serine/threonine protein kinase
VKVTAPGRLGPYELVSLLGAGGMGEVYRARDPRLKRDVALKVLPDGASNTPDRQRRFVQESQAAGALNHPNIVAVYDVGAEDGVHYFVSELVEGVTLRQELQRGPLPLKRLMDFGGQISDGLAAAHDAGLVHRDLKPENVMVTPAGRVKILDFGLAKASTLDGGDVTVTQSAVGLVVGTAPYMSPEQARGAPVDYRSDQFSLGTMLYEMATGVQVFRRETAAQTLSAVLEAEPAPIGEVNPSIPLPLRWVIERCLRKAAEERYTSTADLARDLHTIRDKLPELGSAAVRPVSTPGPTLWTRLRAPAVWLSAAGVAVLALVGALGVLLARSARAWDVDLASYRFSSVATDAGYQNSASWSPDGKTLAYVAEVNGVLQVFTRPVGSPLSVRTQVTRARHDCTDPFWSRDGSRIYFQSLAGTQISLFSVGTAGGDPELLIENAASAALSPDGGSLLFLREYDVPGAFTLWTSTATGTSPRRYMRGEFGSHTLTGAVVRFAPDGSRALAWTWWRGGPQVNKSAFWMLPWPDGEPREVIPAIARRIVSPLPFSWLPDNRHILTAQDGDATLGRHLWVVDVEGDDARQVTMGTGNESSPAVAPDGGSISFAQEDTDFDVVLVPLDGSPPRPVLVTSRNELDPSWSRQDRQFAYISDRTGKEQVWLRSRDGQWERPLVTDDDFPEASRYFGGLSFSPDGQRLAYQRQDISGSFHVFVSTIGGGSAARITTSGGFVNAPTWSPDGNWLAFATRDGLMKVRVGSTAEPIMVDAAIPFTSRPNWSPDGKWIACDTDAGLVLVSPDGRPSRGGLTPTGWLAHGWGDDGATLYGLKESDEDPYRYVFAALDVVTGRTREIGRPIGTIPIAADPIRGFAFVTGEGFLTSIARVRSDIWMLDGFHPPPTGWQRWWPWRPR